MAGRTGGVSTEFLGDTKGLEAAVGRANAAMGRHSRAVRRAGVDWRQFTQNAVYGAEDIASTIGTGGLAGATRAAANNITMMSMAVGGIWGMAAGVAITTTMQLVMAFGKFGEAAEEAAKKAKDALDSYKDELKKGMAQQEKLHDFTQRIKKGSIAERKAALGALREEIAAQKSVLGYLQTNLDLRKENLEVILAEAKMHAAAAANTLETGAVGKGRKAVKEKHAQRALDRSEIEKTRVAAIQAEMDVLNAAIKTKVQQQRWAEARTAGDAGIKRRAEFAKEEQSRIEKIIDRVREEAELRNSLSDKNKSQIGDSIKAEQKKLDTINAQIAEVDYQQSKMEALSFAVEEVDLSEKRNQLNQERIAAERRVSITKEEQLKASEKERDVIRDIRRELDASVDGSKAFAAAFQNVVKKQEEEMQLPADLDMRGPAKGFNNPAARGFRGDSPIDIFKSGQQGLTADFNAPMSDIDKFTVGRSEREKNLGSGIDAFTKNRDAEDRKREDPVKAFMEKRRAEDKAKEDKSLKEAKLTASNTSTANTLLSTIADRLESGNTINVTMGGLLT